MVPTRSASSLDAGVIGPKFCLERRWKTRYDLSPCDR